MRKDSLITMILFGIFTVCACILIIDIPILTKDNTVDQSVENNDCNKSITVFSENDDSEEEKDFKEENVIEKKETIIIKDNNPYIKNLEKTINYGNKYLSITTSDIYINRLLIELKINILKGKDLIKNSQSQLDVDDITNRINYLTGAILETISIYYSEADEYINKLQIDNTKENIDMAKKLVSKLPNGNRKKDLQSKIKDLISPVIETGKDSIFNIGEDIYKKEIIKISDNYDVINTSNVDITYFLVDGNDYIEVEKFEIGSTLDNYKAGTYIIKFEIKDSAGNIGKSERKITLVDKKAPQANIDKVYDNNENFEQVIITTNEDIKDIDGFVKLSNREFYKNYYKNEIVEFYIYDLYDNKALINYEIDSFSD